MNCLCTLGKTSQRRFLRSYDSILISEMTCSSIVGRQSGLPTDGLSLGLQGRLTFSFFPVALCFASSISGTIFLQCLASNKFILELFFTILFQVWHWHPHRSTRDFRLECSHLWPQALVLLSTGNSCRASSRWRGEGSSELVPEHLPQDKGPWLACQI